MKLKEGKAICSEKENKKFGKILKAHMGHGLTHALRRGSAQHMRFNLNMRPEDVIAITKHKEVSTLESYLVSNRAKP